MIMQLADAILLLGMVGCVLVFLADDPIFQAMLWRVPLIIVGLALFSHAMWLLGVWIPGASGFPWPRITADTGLLFLALARAVRVIRAKRRTLATA